MTEKQKKFASEIFAKLDKNLSEEEKAQVMFMEGARYALYYIDVYINTHEKELDEQGCRPIEVWEMEIFDAFSWVGFDCFRCELEGTEDEDAFQEYVKDRGITFSDDDKDEED